MRCTKPSLRKLSFIFAASIALGCSVPSVALPGQAGSEPDNEAVTKAVSDYQATVDAEWTDSNTSTSAAALTSTEQEAHDSRDELANEGTAVTSSKQRLSRTEPLSSQQIFRQNLHTMVKANREAGRTVISSRYHRVAVAISLLPTKSTIALRKRPQSPEKSRTVTIQHHLRMTPTPLHYQMLRIQSIPQ